MNAIKKCEKYKKEQYRYIENQPKNTKEFILFPQQKQIKENYSYNYSFYKPEKSKVYKEENQTHSWQGVL